MFKTIFGKQFAVYMGTFVICFGILGVVLISLIQSFFLNQKENDLVKLCQRIENSIIDDRSIATASFYNQSVEYTGAFTLGFIAMMTDFESMKGSLYAFSTELREEYTEIEHTEFDALLNGKINAFIESGAADLMMENGEPIRITGTMNGIFNENMITVGYPVARNVLIPNLFDGTTVTVTYFFMVFASEPLTEVEAMTREFIRLTLLCILIAAVISLVLVYFSSRTISRPIHKISEAAKVIADGNFEKRIAVKSKDEISQLAESFNYMAERLNDHEEHRREFIANISHDLRSPLTSIKGFLRAIIDGTIEEEHREKYLNIIMDETDRVAKLANDILDISKAQNIGIELNTVDFDVNELIKHTAALFESTAAKNNIEMNMEFSDAKLFVDADREKIQRVIYNLLDNALKFTQPQGVVQIETKIDLFMEKAHIKIKDNGIGMSVEEQKRVFDRFYKVDESRGGDKNGSGLGLSIVREFIKAHGETVEIISEPGKGCEFRFALPLGWGDDRV